VKIIKIKKILFNKMNKLKIKKQHNINKIYLFMREINKIYIILMILKDPNKNNNILKMIAKNIMMIKIKV
jgi:hypothetical protein